MGIFQRIGDVLKSNINDLIDKAEDPEKMVKQIIIDMQQELNKSTQALGKAASSERIAKKQYEDAARSASEWENRAKTALAAGDEELAKKALEKGITEVVFDRGGFIYQGKIKALADAAREAGLNF